MWLPNTDPNDLKEILGKRFHINGEYKIRLDNRKIFVLIRDGAVHCCAYNRQAVAKTQEEAYNFWEPPKDKKKPCPYCNEMICIDEMENGYICYYCGNSLCIRQTYEWITEVTMKEEIQNDIEGLRKMKEEMKNWNRDDGYLGVSYRND